MLRDLISAFDDFVILLLSPPPKEWKEKCWIVWTWSSWEIMLLFIIIILELGGEGEQHLFLPGMHFIVASNQLEGKKLHHGNGQSTSQAFCLQEMVVYHHYFREDLTHQGNGAGRSRGMCPRSHDSLRTELAWQPGRMGRLSWTPTPPHPGSGCPQRALLKTAPLSFSQCWREECSFCLGAGEKKKKTKHPHF